MIRTSLVQVQSNRENTSATLPGRTMRSGDVDQSRLRWVQVDFLIRESRVRFEWFQVFGTGFFDESDLSQVGLGQSGRFPAWRQRTGSAVLYVSEGGNRPDEPLGGYPRPENASVTPVTTSDNYTSGSLPPRWKAHRTVRNHRPPEHVDEICGASTPSISCGTANMPRNRACK